ncbi:MAG: hypothetical protein EAX86_06100 [Candidatus Heimdallarchaeota archaeon]|nr:hypothetical protein [Candidatus Heimdallarchaeota archaeon]
MNSWKWTEFNNQFIFFQPIIPVDTFNCISDLPEQHRVSILDEYVNLCQFNSIYKTNLSSRLFTLSNQNSKSHLDYQPFGFYNRYDRNVRTLQNSQNRYPQQTKSSNNQSESLESTVLKSFFQETFDVDIMTKSSIESDSSTQVYIKLFPLDILENLEDKDTCAFLLSFSDLQIESFDLIFTYFQKNFGIQFILKPPHSITFVESPENRILLIGKRKYEGSAKIITLKKTFIISDSPKIADLFESLDIDQISKDCSIITVSQSEITFPTWGVFFYSQELLSFWFKIQKNSNPLSNETNIFDGKFAAPTNPCGLPYKDWTLESETSEYIEIRHRRKPSIKIKLPAEKIFKSMNSYQALQEYPSIIPPGNKKFFKNWNELNNPAIIEEGFAHTIIVPMVDLRKTKSLTFFTEQPLHVGFGFKGIKASRTKSFWIFSFLSSTFGLFSILYTAKWITQLLFELPVQNLEFIRIPNMKRATKKQKNLIRDIVEKIGAIPVFKRNSLLEEIDKAQKDDKNLLFQLDCVFADIFGFPRNEIRVIYELFKKEYIK